MADCISTVPMAVTRVSSLALVNRCLSIMKIKEKLLIVVKLLSPRVSAESSGKFLDFCAKHVYL